MKIPVSVMVSIILALHPVCTHCDLPEVAYVGIRVSRKAISKVQALALRRTLVDDLQGHGVTDTDKQDTPTRIQLEVGYSEARYTLVLTLIESDAELAVSRESFGSYYDLLYGLNAMISNLKLSTPSINKGSSKTSLWLLSIGAIGAGGYLAYSQISSKTDPGTTPPQTPSSPPPIDLPEPPPRPQPPTFRIGFSF